MSTNEMLDRASRDSMSYPSKNDPRSHEFVAIQNSAYVYTNSRESTANGKASAPINLNPFSVTFTESALETILSGKFANYPGQDDIISDEVVKNIEEGIADINSGRTYTSDQVKKMLGL